MVKDVEIKTNGVFATVKINGENVRCTRYLIEHGINEITVIHLDVLAFTQEYCGKAIVEILNKEEIAKLMSKSEFEIFCNIWLKEHGYKEGDVAK